MALPLKNDKKTPKLTFVKGDGDDVDIFGDAKKKEKPKAGKLEKITVNVPGLQDKLIARQNLKAELDDLKVLFESVQSELKEIGREKFLELYKKHGANHKSFYINDENGCVRVTPSDKYIALTEERAEQLIKKYGEDIVTVDTKFIFNPEVLSRNMEIIKKIIKETKEISIEDKKNLINRQDTYTVSKGAIDKLSDYDKNIVEVMADIQPIFALYDCSSPEKETGGDLLEALDGHICSHCRKECDVMTEQELMHQIAEDSNEGERRKTGGYATPMPRGKEYEVSIGENMYWGTYSIDDNKIMMETCLTFDDEGQEVEVQDNDTRALVYAKVEADHSDEIMDESEYAHELRYEKAADQMGYATGGTMETQKVVLQPYNYSGMGRNQLVFVDTKYAHPDTGKSMMWGYSKNGDVADFKGLFEPTGEKIELEYNVKSSQSANQQKSARVTAIREYVGEMKADGGKLENAVLGGVRGALKQPILSAKKRDYTVNVDTKTLEVDVNITGADTVDQSALTDAAEWTQFHWGYMVYPKNIDELLATMKVLKVKTSRKELIKFLPAFENPYRISTLDTNGREEYEYFSNEEKAQEKYDELKEDQKEVALEKLVGDNEYETVASYDPDDDEFNNWSDRFEKGGRPIGRLIDEDGVDHFAAAKTSGLDSQDFEAEAMEYAGEHWYTLNEKQRSDLIYEIKNSRFIHFDKGGNVSAQKKITDTRGNTFWLTKIDTTHFFLSNSLTEKGNALHIGQIRNEPYYNEVNQWLENKPSFEVGEIVWDEEHKCYGVVLDVFKNGDVKLDSDGVVSDTHLHKLGSDEDSGEKIDLIQAMLRHKRLVDKFPSRYERINYATGGGLDERAFAQLNKLKSEGKLKRYFDVRGNGQKLFETIIPNKSEKGMYKRYESSSASSLGVLQNEYLDETDILNYLKKTLPKLISREDITILGVPRNKITDREWESILEMAKHLDGATFILKDENFNDVKPQVEYEWYVNEPKAKGGDRKKYIEKEQKWFGKKLATGGGAGKKITQEQAHEILVRNNMFAGGNVPFDKTTNYIGMLEEINAHRRIWNAKELN
jgi:hypothetical protein